jgi:hypothetical protein
MIGGAARMVAAWLCLAVTVGAAGPGDIRVVPVVADGKVSASFVAPSVLSGDARAVLQSGLLLTFRFIVALRRPNGFWWDPTLQETTVAVSVKYDNLTGAYQVSKLVDEHVIWSDRTTDLAQVRAWVTTFDRVPLLNASELDPNVDYYIHVRMWTSPRQTFPLWPFGGDDGAGRADFTHIR